MLSIDSGWKAYAASPPSALPGISPSRGEIGKTLSCHFILKR